MSVPKANTFYAVFVTFYSLRSWMGRFTVEVIFSRREDAPEVWSQIAPDGSGVIAEGSCQVQFDGGDLLVVGLDGVEEGGGLCGQIFLEAGSQMLRKILLACRSTPQ